METIGFIGLGNMGSGIASNILKSGYPLIVFDTRKESAAALVQQGARLAASGVQVARESDITFTSLPGPKEVEEVVLGSEGILNGITAGKVYVDLSTNNPTLIRRLAREVEGKQAFMLDAPVSGGKAGAKSGNLAVMVGGPREIYDRVTPVFDTFGDKPFYAGPIGNGTVCKLVHNLMAQCLRQVVAEGMTLGVKAGVDTKTLWEAVRRGAVGRMRFLHESIVTTVFKGQFESPGFTLGLAKKDMDLIIELASDTGVPLPVTTFIHETFIQAMSRGWTDKDSNILFTLQEEAAAVQVRASDIDVAKAARFITTHPDLAG